MKKITLSFLAVISAILLFAQSPQAFKYQALVRDNAGEIIASQSVSFRISIRTGNAGGTVVYRETHLVTTNAFGMVNLNIGEGTIVSGSFISIDWGTGTKFMEVEFDQTGGSNYISMGTSQLLSVPYALYSENTANTDDADADPLNELQIISKVGNTVTLSDAGGSFTDEIDDADADPANELQIISKSGNTVTLSDGGGAFVDETDDGDFDPTNEFNTGLVLSGNSLEVTDDGGTLSVDLGTLSSDSDWTISGNNMYSTVTGNVGIGTSTPTAKLDVAGRISISNTGGSVFLGKDAGLNDDLSNWNVFIGQTAGYSNVDGWSNIAIGKGALYSSNSEAWNVAVGTNALYNNTSGSDNTAIGDLALNDNITGSSNTALGYHALSGNLGTGNVAVGSQAGSQSINSSNCVFIGRSAGYYENSDNKLYIENTYSPSPLIYGDFSANIVGVNGKLGIGTQNPGSPLTVSGNAVISGNIGIGTTTPSVKAHIVGGADATLAGGGFIVIGATTGQNIVMDENEIMARNNGAISSLHLQRNGGAFNLHYAMTEVYEFVVAADGKTGIGENAPTSKLHINTNAAEDGLRVQINGGTKLKVSSNGGISNYNATTPTFAFQLENSSVDIRGRGIAYSWHVYSDNRLKSNQRSIEYGLKEVMQLQPKSYDHHSSSTSENGDFVMVTDEKAPAIGFIAQEMHLVIPEAVSKPEDASRDLWSMDYDKLIPVLTKAIQEQQAMIEDMQLEIEALKIQSKQTNKPTN